MNEWIKSSTTEQCWVFRKCKSLGQLPVGPLWCRIEPMFVDAPLGHRLYWWGYSALDTMCTGHEEKRWGGFAGACLMQKKMKSFLRRKQAWEVWEAGCLGDWLSFSHSCPFQGKSGASWNQVQTAEGHCPLTALESEASWLHCFVPECEGHCFICSSWCKDISLLSWFSLHTSSPSLSPWMTDLGPIITFTLLWSDAMTKSTFRRHFISACTGKLSAGIAWRQVPDLAAEAGCLTEFTF